MIPQKQKQKIIITKHPKSLQLVNTIETSCRKYCDANPVVRRLLRSRIGNERRQEVLTDEQ